MSIETRVERKAKGPLDSLEVVIVDGREVGFITKYNSTNTETHPTKAYFGIGHNAVYLGAATNTATPQRVEF